MKNDSTTKYVLTLDYGYLPIRYNKDFTESLGLDLIEVGPDEFYEVRKNQNGKLVLVEV